MSSLPNRQRRSEADRLLHHRQDDDRTCRQRAWEQSRAAASGCAAVEVVERVVEVPVRPIPGVEVPRERRHLEWVTLLEELARQIRDRGSVYDRDLQKISNAVLGVNTALEERLSKNDCRGAG